MLPKIDSEDRQLLFSLSLLTGAGSIAGIIVLTQALDLISRMEFGQGGEGESSSLPLLLLSLLVYAIPGALIAAGQWFELRNLLPRAGWWILSTAVGWSLGFGLGNLVFAFVTALPPLILVSIPLLFIGLLSGLAQWLILRQTWPQSAPWIVVAILVALVGGFSWLIAGVIGGAIGWVIAGAISGYSLIAIRNRSLLT